MTHSLSSTFFLVAAGVLLLLAVPAAFALDLSSEDRVFLVSPVSASESVLLREQIAPFTRDMPGFDFFVEIRRSPFRVQILFSNAFCLLGKGAGVTFEDAVADLVMNFLAEGYESLKIKPAWYAPGGFLFIRASAFYGSREAELTQRRP